MSDITSELSTNLIKSIVVPGGLLEWLSRPLSERLRERLKLGPVPARTAEGGEAQQRSAVANGPLVLLGGAPVPDEAIVAMIHLAGGRSARLAVIAAASENPAQAAEEGVRLFTRFGMRQVQVLDLVTRERADSPEWVAKLAEFEAVLICGESCSRGLEVLRGTLAVRTLSDMMAAGKPVAGLAAGAAICGEQAIAEVEGQLQLTEGLGLAPGLLVDDRFTQQSRLAPVVKLLGAEVSRAALGAGIDAGSAVVVRAGEAKVLGDNSVTFLDPRDSAAAAGVKVHVLMDGYGFNLRSRRPTGLANQTPQAVGER